jgi:bifunctional non-homologous end joining protein LigD
MSTARPPGSTKLTAYRDKRNFEKTSEPSGGGAPGEGGARFVIHEHHATRLHWDLRLEHDGALASWAVPNGIPQHPKHNRKAIHVEDHPLSYLEFEGTIASGNYGAGEVMIWDSGTYTCEKWTAGEVIVVFEGERLRGRYALFRAGDSERDWMIHRMDPPTDPTAEEMPPFIEPMLARLSTLPAEESNWAFEVKWDGVRALAHSQPGRIHFTSRTGHDVTVAYPELRALNPALGSHSAILDGEVVAFDAGGRPSFEALQPRMHLRSAAAVRRRAQATPVTYVIFDLLWLDGHSLTTLPYAERRARLATLKLDGERWCAPDFHAGEGAGLLAATREQGLEGVVAKRLDSPYTPGRRSDNWLKIKHSLQQELVIGGWTEGKGARSQRIGALHVGVYDQHELRYAGRVGTGFDEAELERLAAMLQPLARADSPFAGRQPPRGAHFVEPQLVCEVEFNEWTKGGLLRQPSYKGLRDDKLATEVVRERGQPPPEHSGGRQASRPADTHATPVVAPEIQDLVAAGRAVRGGVEIQLDGLTLKLTNLDKVIFPHSGFTKGHMIAYYAAIAPVLLPHLADRPLTLKRYPDGVEGEHFYEKQCPKYHPDWVHTTAIWSESNKGPLDYCLCQDLPTLVWVANLAAIELHPSLSRAQAIERPTVLVFDLDPGAPAGIVECCRVGLELRDVFAELGLRSFAKTSGSKGLQVYVPLGGEHLTYEHTKPFSHAVADVLEQRHPRLVLSSMAKTKRRGRVFIDWSQNDEHKTTVAAYSLRAGPLPGVSTPVSWEEVQECRDTRSPLQFEVEEVLRRVTDRGDLFAEVLSLQQTLPSFGQRS